MPATQSRPQLLHGPCLILFVRSHHLFFLIDCPPRCCCLFSLPKPCIPSVLFPRPCPPPLWDSTWGTWPWVWDEARTSWEETSPTVSSSRSRSASISSSAAGASKRSWTDRLGERISSGQTLIFPPFSVGSYSVISTRFYFIRIGVFDQRCWQSNGKCKFCLIWQQVNTPAHSEINHHLYNAIHVQSKVLSFQKAVVLMRDSFTKSLII